MPGRRRSGAVANSWWHRWSNPQTRSERWPHRVSRRRAIQSPRGSNGRRSSPLSGPNGYGEAKACGRFAVTGRTGEAPGDRHFVDVWSNACRNPCFSSVLAQSLLRSRGAMRVVYWARTGSRLFRAVPQHRARLAPTTRKRMRASYLTSGVRGVVATERIGSEEPAPTGAGVPTGAWRGRYA